jgi:hypothetical protein
MKGVEEIEVRPFSGREDEPSAGNSAPNRVLEKLGFAFIRRYRTTPGVIAYEQDVNRYELRRPNQRPQPTQQLVYRPRFYAHS